MIPYDDQEHLVQRVFKELQDRSLINTKRKLKHLKENPTRRPLFRVRVKIPCRPSIEYSFGNCAFDESSLRFILMHEEKHIKSPMSWLIPTILILIDIYFLLWLIPLMAAAKAFLIAFVILLAIWYGSIPLLRYGEVRADIWSARKLKSDFGVRTPSEVVLKALDWPDVVESRLRKAVRSLTIGPIHPSVEERVERIAKEVDEHPENPP